MPDFPYARVGKLAVQDTRRQSFTPDDWVKLERCARLYWSNGLSRYNKDGSDRGYLPLTKGKNKGKPSLLKALTSKSTLLFGTKRHTHK